VLIRPADAMEAEGLARYLKALEEPPDGTVFGLVSTRPDRLPETVLSRCRRVRLPPASREEVESRLREDGIEAPLAARIARSCGGSVARARRMARSRVVAVGDALVAAASSPQPRAAKAVEEALKALEKAPSGGDESDAPREGGAEESGIDGRRERVRTALGDLVHALASAARDVAAGRAAPPLDAVRSERATPLLARLVELAAAIPSYVTPAVVLLELVVALRDATTTTRHADSRSFGGS
jgi:hypothetical protein